MKGQETIKSFGAAKIQENLETGNKVKVAELKIAASMDCHCALHTIDHL